MKFQVSSSTLSSNLQIVGRVINPKNPREIMQCFCLNIEGKTLIATATDADLTLTASIELQEAEKDFSFAVNAERLLNALKTLPDQPLSISVNEESFEMVISYQNGKYTLMGLSAEDFPERKETSEETSKVVMTAEALSDGITRTLFAASNDDFKPLMCGVYVDIYTDKITFVSTDTHKMVRYILYHFNGEKEDSFILPKRPANLLKTILPKNEDEVTIVFDKKKAQFTFERFHLDCSLTEGTYPKYNSVIPKSSPYTLVIDKQSLISALRRVSVFSNQENNLLRFEIANNQVKILAEDIDYSTSAEEILIGQYDGELLRIGFKAPFLIDLINNIETPEVRLGLTDPSRPGIISPVEGRADVDMLMLLMPMMITR